MSATENKAHSNAINELIMVTTNESDEPVVSGRVLHGFLEVKDHYTDWFKRMVSYGFAENIDFVGLTEKSDKPIGGRPSIDHTIAIPMAKEIAMLQRNEKGKQARQYFIQLEKDWNSPEKVMARALKIAERLVTQRIEIDLNQNTIMALERVAVFNGYERGLL